MESTKVELAMGNAVSDAAQGSVTRGFCGASRVSFTHLRFRFRVKARVPGDGSVRVTGASSSTSQVRILDRAFS